MPYSGPSGERAHGKILVVDDDERFRTLIHAMLAKAGYQVLEAENGRAALEVLRQGLSLQSPVVDLILCDLRMPEMDGMEAITVFRSDFPAVPVAVLTGFPDIEVAPVLLDQGVIHYTFKPIEREKLLALVDRAMERKSAVKSSSMGGI